MSSTTHGYVAGGNDSSASAGTAVIQKYTFASNGNSASVGNLTIANDSPGGHSPKTHGYSVGGREAIPATRTRRVEKYSFSVDGNATDVSRLTEIRMTVATSSSATHGYTAGGYTPSLTNTIDRYSFASNSDSFDVGDMVVFSNTWPQRYKKNKSNSDRRTLYYTYTQSKNGSKYNQYFFDKEKSKNTSKAFSEKKIRH